MSTMEFVDTELLHKSNGESSNDPEISPSQGLAVLKELWAAGSRFADLQREYAGRKIPIEKIFGALLGFGDKPDPLADIKRQLEEINAKLDRVLAGIQEIQKGLLGVSLLSVYLDISDSVFLIEKYAEALPNYVGGDPSVTDADRKDFAEKLLGVRSERDGVAFCAQKLIKLGPNNTPLLFDLLYPYITIGVTAPTSFDCFLRGAFVFRFVTDVLMKGMILELFAAAVTGDQAKLSERAEKVTKKYRKWMRTLVDNSFLPFAERLATLGFLDEYMGRHDTRTDANVPLELWRPAPRSILQSADTVVARLMGYSKGVTLRVLANVAPIAQKVPASKSSGAISPGTYEWEIVGQTVDAVTRKPVTLTKAEVLDKMEPSAPPFFQVNLKGSGSMIAQHTSRARISFMDGAPVPPGFDRANLTFLRYEFSLNGAPDRAQFSFAYGNPPLLMSTFPLLETTWQRIYIEDGHRFPEDKKTFKQAVLDMNPGEFDLPAEGQLSPVLVPYAYNLFGQRPGPR
ncbi:MAG: hypothetical protein JST22_18945 [Bacteroidetes bacterium]|nr:hypothetical protein [Bacteroidota bacterium]